MVILVVDDAALDSCPRLDRAQPRSIEGDDRLVVAVVDADEVVELSRGKLLRLVKNRRYRDSASAARNVRPPAACRRKRSDAASRACHRRSVTVRRRRPCGDTPTRRPISGRPHIGAAGGRAYIPGHGRPERHGSAPRPRAHDPRQLPRLPGGAAAHPGFARHGRRVARLRILPVGPFGSTSTNQTLCGYLQAATRRLTKSRSSAALIWA